MECPFAPTFMVVDLASQASAVSQFVRGWSKEQILEWLSRQGELVTLEAFGRRVYRFSSRVGFQTTFFLDGDEFTFIGDNTTWQPQDR